MKLSLANIIGVYWVVICGLTGRPVKGTYVKITEVCSCCGCGKALCNCSHSCGISMSSMKPIDLELFNNSRVAKVIVHVQPYPSCHGCTALDNDQCGLIKGTMKIKSVPQTTAAGFTPTENATHLQNATTYFLTGNPRALK